MLYNCRRSCAGAVRPLAANWGMAQKLHKPQTAVCHLDHQAYYGLTCSKGSLGRSVLDQLLAYRLPGCLAPEATRDSRCRGKGATEEDLSSATTCLPSPPSACSTDCSRDSASKGLPPGRQGNLGRHLLEEPQVDQTSGHHGVAEAVRPQVLSSARVWTLLWQACWAPTSSCLAKVAFLLQAPCKNRTVCSRRLAQLFDQRTAAGASGHQQRSCSCALTTAGCLSARQRQC